MCGGGGGRTPTREPTPSERYASQIGDFTRLTNQRNQQRAQQFNDQVSAFRTQASDAERRLNALNQTARGLNLRDFNNARFDWNNGQLTRSDQGRGLRDLFGDIERDFGNLQSGYERLQSSRPDFISSVNGFTFRGGQMGNAGIPGEPGDRGFFNPGGARLGDDGILDYGGGSDVFVNVPLSFSAPTLQSLPDIGRLSSLSGNVFNSILDLERRFESETGRLNEARTNFETGLGDLRTQIGDLTINDEAMARQLQRQIGTLRGQVSGFQSPLDFDRNSLLSQLDALNAIDENDNFTSIAELLQNRNRELERVNRFRTEIGGELNALNQQFGGLGLGSLGIGGNLEGALGNLGNLQNALSEIEGRVSGFDTQLNADFGREMEMFNRLMGQIESGRGRIDSLMGSRAAEQDRIAGTEAELAAAIADLQSQAGGLGINDLDRARAIESQLSRLRAQAGGFRSELGFNFADELAPADQIMAQLTDVRARNTAERERVNQLLGQSSTDLDSLLAQLNGLNPNSLTIADEQGITGLGSQLDQLRAVLEREQNDLGGIDTELTSVNSTAQQRRLQQAQSTLERLASQQQGLVGRRQAELDRLQMLEDTLGADISAAQGNLSGLTLRDAGNARSLISEAQRRLGQLGSLQSPLGLDRFNDERASLEALIASGNDLLGRRAAEDQRIADFRRQQATDAQALIERARGLNIANGDDFTALERALQDEQLQYMGFQSELDPDFMREQGMLQTAGSLFEQMQQRRQAEQDRVRMAQDDFQQRINALSSDLSAADIYDGRFLNTAGSDLAGLRQSLTGFQTPLAFDRSQLEQALAAAEQTLGQRRSARDTALGNLRTQISDAIGGTANINETDETGFRDARANLADLQSYLNMFSGGGTDTLANELRTGMSGLDGRIRNITTQRSNIEREAQALRDALKEMSFINSDALTPQQQAFEALRRRSEQWGALQANDEFSTIEGRLGSERNRLQRDAEAITRRNALDRARVFSAADPFGNLTFAGQRAISPSTFDTIQSQVNAMSPDDLERLMSQQDLNAFARNLGILRV